MTPGAGADRPIEVGGRWTTKDGSRSIVIVAAPPPLQHNGWARVRNVESGRQWNISAVGLRAKYTPDDLAVPSVIRDASAERVSCPECDALVGRQCVDLRGWPVSTHDLRVRVSLEPPF